MNRFSTPEEIAEKKRKQRLSRNILDSINNIKDWWFRTWNRVNRTRGWNTPKLTLVKITTEDIVHILRNMHWDYYRDRLDQMLPDYKPEILDTANFINHELLPNELAKLDTHVETQITKLVAEKKNKQSQNAFAKAIFLPNDVDAWTDIFENIKRSSLYEPLKDYKYGNKTVKELYEEYVRRFTIKQNEYKKSKKPKPKPQQPKRPDAREDVIAYPFRSKISKYRRQNPNIEIKYNKIPSIERIPEKQLYRPYFCPEPGGWEIDFAFKICNDNDKTDNEEIINALGRLIQQEQFWLCEQHLCQSGTLLLATGQVIGVAVQQMFNFTDSRNFRNLLFVPGHLRQIFPDSFLHKQALGVLGQHGKAAAEQFCCLIFFDRLTKHFHLAPVGLTDAADGL